MSPQPKLYGLRALLKDPSIDCLLQLFERCPVCSRTCNIEKTSKGTLSITQTCPRLSLRGQDFMPHLLPPRRWSLMGRQEIETCMEPAHGDLQDAVMKTD